MRNLFIVTNCDKGMKFRVMVIVDGKAIDSGLRVDTKAAAKKYAENILSKRYVMDSYYIDRAADLPPSISGAELIRRVTSGKWRA